MADWDALCVKGVALKMLQDAPVGTVIWNGHRSSRNYFVKTGYDCWRPCGRDGKPWSNRPFESRYCEPLWEGPFASDHIHWRGLTMCWHDEEHDIFVYIMSKTKGKARRA